MSLALQAYAALATSADRGRCGIFRSSSRSVEGLGFEKTAPLWRRFCASWVAPRAASRLAPTIAVRSLRSGLPCGPFVILVAACGGCLRFPRAHRGCSQRAARPGAASFDGCGVAGAVVGGGFAPPAETARAASFCIRGLRRGGVGCGGRTLPGGECWRVLRGLLFAVHAYSSSHAAFAVTPTNPYPVAAHPHATGSAAALPPPIPGWLRRRGGVRTGCPGRRG